MNSSVEEHYVSKYSLLFSTDGTHFVEDTNGGLVSKSYVVSVFINFNSLHKL